MSKTKGVILCGGTGTRLHPLTLVTNKALLPVANEPMIYYPIRTLIDSGITDILLVCGGNAAGEFLRILGNGAAFGLKRLHYTYQPKPAGIADALSLAREFVDGNPMCVILSDNILQYPFQDIAKEFEESPIGAKILLTEVENPEWYGVVTLDESEQVVEIVEKPKDPKSNLISIGVYFYDSKVWELIDNLTPSNRGELEITDLNNLYLKRGQLKAHRINGWWGDAGESLDVYMKTFCEVYGWKKMGNIAQ